MAKKIKWIIYRMDDRGHARYLTCTSDAENITTFSRWRHEAHLFETRKQFNHLLQIDGILLEKIYNG